MIGIYKITNPKSKIYIGQSIDIKRRFYEYQKKIRCYSQKKLYNSLIKYGVDNHNFTVIEECEIELLNERERYWQDHYNVLMDGLNLLLTNTKDKNGENSDETKSKISKSLKQYFNSLPTQKKQEIYGKSSRQRKGKLGNRKNSILTEEHKKKLSQAKKGSVLSDETKEKIRKWTIENQPMNNDASRKKISEGRMGIKFSEEHKKNLSLAKVGKPSNKKGKKPA